MDRFVVWLERGLIYGGFLGITLLGLSLLLAQPPWQSPTSLSNAAAPEGLGDIAAHAEGPSPTNALDLIDPTDTPDDEGASASSSPQQVAISSTPAPDTITRLRIARIGLDAEVVPSPFDKGTWELPAFKVGYAEGTGSLGRIGNAILFGHVTSIRVGHVFRDLDQLQVGDSVTVSGGQHDYRYRVVEKRTVPRTDTSILRSTPTASVSLITCAGSWLPLEGDYTERLLVRAELART